MRTMLRWMFLLPLLSISSLGLSGCGSELGADWIFNTTVHLTIKPLAAETSLPKSALNVAWVYRPESTSPAPGVGSTTRVDCASQNAKERYCITPSLEVITRDWQSGQFDVKVGAPQSWLLAASEYKVGLPKVYAVIAICKDSASVSPECVQFAEGVSIYYTRGLGFSLTFLQSNRDEPVPSDSELVVEEVRDLPRELPKLFSPNLNNF